MSPLLPLGVASCCGVREGDWGASCLGEANLGVCLLLPWKAHPSVASPCGLFSLPTFLQLSLGLANGLAHASVAFAHGLVRSRSPKWSLALGVGPPPLRSSAFDYAPSLWQTGLSEDFGISWSLISLLVSLL